MANPARPTYKRILLKLSGEALAGEQGFGINAKTIDEIARGVAAAVATGVAMGIVLGGGKNFRGVGASSNRMDRFSSGHGSSELRLHGNARDLYQLPGSARRV